jgi:hypothetical protein
LGRVSLGFPPHEHLLMMMMNLMNPPLKFVAIAFNDYGGIGFSRVLDTQLSSGRTSRGW